jgi:hypothetical protein
MKFSFVKIIVLLLFLGSVRLSAQENNVLGTSDIVFTPDGKNVIMAQKKARLVVLMERNSWRILAKWEFSEPPTGLFVRDNQLFVTSSYAQAYLSRINLLSGKVEDKLSLGMGAVSPVVTKDGSRLYVCNQYQNMLTEIDLGKMKVVQTVKMDREPNSVVLSKDESELYVANFLPQQRADLEFVAAKVNVVSVKSFKTITQISLTNGSNALRDICLSPDGDYVFVSHNLGRFQVPTSQLQQGWMNTSGVSVIRTKDKSLVGTFLVDEPESGAAGVWGLQCDGNNLVVSQSGTHDISVIDYPKLVERIENTEDKESLSYNLQFLQGIRTRLPVYGNGPRNFVMDDAEILIPTYFSDTLSIVKRSDLSVSVINYNPDFKEDIAQKGEKYFNDANYCFQGWQSCNGCHPGDARTDGMNWDLLNDGIGNPKNCKSMLFSHRTPPAMISGIRPDAETAVRAGFVHIQFAQVAPERTRAVDEYLKSLTPLPSPFLLDGELSPKAIKGKEVFKKASCNFCHSGPLFTNLEMYRIGEVEFEAGWDTPALIEVWRTAPYLHDGSAASLEELFLVKKHGLDSHRLKNREIEELIEYINSL